MKLEIMAKHQEGSREIRGLVFRGFIIGITNLLRLGSSPCPPRPISSKRGPGITEFRSKGKIQRNLFFCEYIPVQSLSGSWAFGQVGIGAVGPVRGGWIRLLGRLELGGGGSWAVWHNAVAGEQGGLCTEAMGQFMENPQTSARQNITTWPPLKRYGIEKLPCPSAVHMESLGFYGIPRNYEKSMGSIGNPLDLQETLNSPQS